MELHSKPNKMCVHNQKFDFNNFAKTKNLLFLAYEKQEEKEADEQE